MSFNTVLRHSRLVILRHYLDSRQPWHSRKPARNDCAPGRIRRDVQNL